MLAKHKTFSFYDKGMPKYNKRLGVFSLYFLDGFEMNSSWGIFRWGCTEWSGCSI